MAFYSGTAASFAALKSALTAACVSEGWQLTNDVLSRNNCFVQLTAQLKTLQLSIGNGQDANGLTDEPTSNYGGGPKIVSADVMPFEWPINYDIHINQNPDEVYCIVNYNNDFYQQLSFGQSNVAGIGGTGNWCTGSATGTANSNVASSVLDLSLSKDFFITTQGLFYLQAGFFLDNTAAASFVHTQLDNEGWITSAASRALGSYCASLLYNSPGVASASTVLVPVKCVKKRPQNGLTIVANLANARFCMIDYLAPGQIITYGPDRWKIYPLLRRNLAVRGGSTNAQTGANAHSGAIGYAIRYTGP